MKREYRLTKTGTWIFGESNGKVDKLYISPDVYTYFARTEMEARLLDNCGFATPVKSKAKRKHGNRI